MRERKKQEQKEQGRKRQQGAFEGADNSAGTGDEYTQPSTAKDREQTWYEILGVSSTATLDQIKKAYREKIVQYHPDKVVKLGPELKELALRMSQEINSAYRQAKTLRRDSD